MAYTSPRYAESSHSLLVGYLLWLVGFTGAHRFYYGKQLTGTLWFFTGGLFLVGWAIDFLLIPLMDRKADRRYLTGPWDYSLAWLLLTFLGLFGMHRFYQGKWISGLIYFCTGGLFFAGWLYDLWTLNEQVDELNRQALGSIAAR